MVFEANFSLRFAVLIDAFFRSEYSEDSGLEGGELVGGVVAVVLDDAVEVVAGVGVLGSVNAVFPAGEGGVASVVAEVQHSDASSVVFTGLLLVLAVLLDTVLGVGEGHHCRLP